MSIRSYGGLTHADFSMLQIKAFCRVRKGNRTLAYRIYSREHEYEECDLPVQAPQVSSGLRYATRISKAYHANMSFRAFRNQETQPCACMTKMESLLSYLPGC